MSSSVPQTYVHQCSVCKDWQMEYDIGMAMETWGEYRIEDYTVVPHMKPMHDALNGVLEDHLREEHPLHYAAFRATGKLP